MTEPELQPAEPAELESELEMRPESRPGAELPSAQSELQQKKEKQRYKKACISRNGNMMVLMWGSLPGTEGVVEVAVTGVTTALATAA